MSIPRKHNLIVKSFSCCIIDLLGVVHGIPEEGKIVLILVVEDVDVEVLEDGDVRGLFFSVLFTRRKALHPAE